MLGQSLRVTKTPQPAGEAGVFHSLEQVARKVSEGAVHPKVRAWAIEQLTRARKVEGIPCNSDRQRAQVLLRAVQRKLWVPDPVNSEFIAGAHLMACDRSTKDEICFLSGDCDDLVTLLGAAFLSVGLNTMVVGHAYDSGKKISHVLTSVRVDGRWMYADPTPDDFKLGECVEFTRERILSVPNIQVLCDSESCLTDKSAYDPDKNDFVTEGHYIGVDGVPKLAWLRKRTQNLGAVSVSAEAVIERCTAGRETTKEDLKGAAGCAADGFCLTYGVPPGICGGVTDAILDAIDDALSAEAGPGFEGMISKTMYLHNRLFPHEPPWDWVRAPPGRFGVQRMGYYYLPNAAVIEAYRQQGYTFNPNDVTAWNNLIPPASFLRANYQVQQALSVRAAKEKAQAAARRRKLVPATVVAVGAAGAAAWYFWDDLVRFARRL